LFNQEDNQEENKLSLINFFIYSLFLIMLYLKYMKHFLRHLFIPHESNNHRSRVLHHDSLFLIVAILFAGIVIIQGAQRQYPAVLGDTTQITVPQLLQDTNLAREANGLPPLTLNSELTHAAQMKANDMFAKDYWAHVSPNGTTPWVWIRQAGYNYLYAGENLARGFTTSQDVVNAWMNSPEHRANMLSPNYTDIGFAVESGTLTGTQTTLVVQEFGSPYNTNGTVTETGSVTVSPTPLPEGAIASAGMPTSPSAKVVASNIQMGQPAAIAGQEASVNQPFIDAISLKRNIAFVFIGFFILILAIDAIVIERKQIVRAFSHNVDHILFLLFILLAGIIIGSGAIL
jgi:Cysteine-rich secretory protein family